RAEAAVCEPQLGVLAHPQDQAEPNEAVTGGVRSPPVLWGRARAGEPCRWAMLALSSASRTWSAAWVGLPLHAGNVPDGNASLLMTQQEPLLSVGRHPGLRVWAGVFGKDEPVRDRPGGEVGQPDEVQPAGPARRQLRRVVRRLEVHAAARHRPYRQGVDA